MAIDNIINYDPSKDRLLMQNAGNMLYQKVTAGNNQLQNILENNTVGRTSMGTPYYDSVIFWLNEDYYTEGYVNCVISANKMINISTTTIQGRGANVLQYVDKGGWEIVFNIKLVSDFQTNEVEDADNIKERLVGRNPSPIMQDIATLSNPLSVFDSPANFRWQTDYQPDKKLKNVLEFFDKFFDDVTYQNIRVTSKFLNNNLGVERVIPYSINTAQNVDYTNQYDITIACYSDIDSDAMEYNDEIIPTGN